jgi:PAS domain S-box-containing protein
MISIKTKLNLFGIFIILLTLTLTTISIAWVLTENNITQSRIELQENMKMIQAELEFDKKRLLSSSQKTAELQELGLKIKHISRNKDSYSQNIQPVYIELANAIHDAARIAGNVWKTMIYDTQGDLISFSHIEQDYSKEGYVFNFPEAEYMIADGETLVDPLSNPWRRVSKYSGFDSHYEEKIPTKETIIYSKSDSKLTIKSFHPIMGLNFNKELRKMTSSEVGFVLAENPLDYLFIDKIKKITSNKEINIFVSDKDNMRLTVGTLEQYETLSKAYATNQKVKIGNTNYIQEVLPLYNNDKLIGTIALLQIEKTIIDYVLQLLKSLIIVFIIILSIVVPITVIIIRTITKPLISLQQGIKEISSGNLGNQLEIYANDEIGQLTMSFNNMSKELAKTDKIKILNTQLKKTSQQLKNEREQFLSILDSIPEIVYVADMHTHEVLFANKHLCNKIGHDITGEICYQAIQGKTDVCDFCTNKHIRDSNEPYFWEYYNPILDIHLYVMNRKLNWAEQKEVRFELAIDITENKKAENALKKSEEKYRLIAENASDVIWILNITENKFTYISPSVYNLRGYTPEEAMQQDINQSLAPESAKEVKESISKVITQFLANPDEIAKKIYRHELRQTCKDGSTIWIETTTHYQFNPNNEIEVIGMSRDITDRKKAQDELSEKNRFLEEATARANSMAAKAEAANSSKSEFLANMSHEIRTPMNSVIGFSELLQNTDLNKVQKQYVDTILFSGKSLLNIINDILDFSKIEAGKLELEIIQTDLIDLIEQTADLIKYPASKKCIELLLNIDSKIPRFAMIDPVRVRQILANLLSNALKFTPKGEIELKASLLKMEGKRGHIKFSVRDTGIGVSDAQKKKLFKAFSQADNSTTRKFGGTGLGLVISDQLAQKMGGKLEIESVQGEGSEFYFTIGTELKEGEKIKTSDISKIGRCLVIDDNQNNRTIMKHIVEKWDIECVTCDNGFKSLKIIETSKVFDVIVCDYHMPYIDGLETVKMIREKLELPPEKQPIILLHSSSDDAELQNKCKELGINFRLTKPVKQTELLNCFLNIQQGVFEEQNDEKPKTKTDLEIEINPDASTYKILIAEDNPNNMLLASILIKQIIPSAEIIEAENGKDAFDKIVALKPDLVFMDVQMPEMDGNEATLKLREFETKENISTTIVIGLTAGALKQEKQKSLQSGMNDFLTKPIETDKLKDLLRKYLKMDTGIEPSVNSVLINNSEHFDRESLLGFFEGDWDIFKRIIIKFMEEDFDTKIENLEGFIESYSFEEAAKIAHSLKGLALNFRCGILSKLIQNIEKEILAEKKEESLRLLQKIKEELKILTLILKDIISG